MCDPSYEEVRSREPAEFQIIIEEALEAIGKNLREPRVSCPREITDVPSKFFLDQTSKGFCERVMQNLGERHGPTAYDIQGNELPHRKSKRTPPENIESFESYTFFLEYEPKDGDCMVDNENLCSNAYQVLIQDSCKLLEAPPPPFRPPRHKSAG